MLSDRFWWRWVLANALGELLGLGAAAAAGYLVMAAWGEPRGVAQVLLVAAMFVGLGAIEGWVVGWAQARVLARRFPGLSGWTRASIVGAVVAWVLGMMPSTVMNLLEPAASGQPPEWMSDEGVRLALAAGLGLVAGPVLALFQWRVLRRHVRRALWWLPANALAWAVGMPVIFLGVDLAAAMPNLASVLLSGAAAIALAGASVGAIHGAVLRRLLAASP